ncbi:hypothetical protein D3C83_331660 [compost metagenome]
MRRSGRPQLENVADIEILIELDDKQHGREVLEELARLARAYNFELLPEPTSRGLPIL